MGTALSFLWAYFPPKPTFSVDDIPDLTGKVIMVTGGNTGIGKETIKGLLQHNATVYLAARSPSKAKEAIEELKASTGKEARFLQLDLSDLKSIKESAREFTENEKELHVLINNAGVMMPPIEQVTKDGYDLQFGTNVLGKELLSTMISDLLSLEGPFYFTKLLLPVLLSTAKTSGNARVVTVASGAGLMMDSIKFDTLKDGSARKKLSKAGLYLQSKLGDLVYATELTRRYGDQGIVSVPLDPGPSRLICLVTSIRSATVLMGHQKIISYPVSYGALTPLYVATLPDGASLSGKFFVPWAREGKLSKDSLDPQLGKDLWAWMEEQVAPFESYFLSYPLGSGDDGKWISYDELNGCGITHLHMAVFSPLIRELDIFLGFWRDWSTTIIPGSIFAAGAMHGPSIPSIITHYFFLVSWLTPYIHFFNWPIPSGKVTVSGAKQRWAFAFSTFMGIALYTPSLLPETICWVLTVAFLCLTSAGSHWFGKNCVAMTTGTWALLSASWKAIAPATPKSDIYVYAIALWVGLIMHVQDLRDIQGDAAIGRKTMPLVFGDRGSRLIITFLLLPAAYWVLWMGDIVRLAPYTLAAVHIILAYRILQAGGSRYDHKTYMFYTYIFCLILAFTASEGLDIKVPGLISALDLSWMGSAGFGVES
ncbi:hypothetical protein EW146_g9959 [Bondarzewia mesenterica]|uniref:Uncharacterized protein n=1 Tax=Bondarzewia mesenterica TaxID=1095465 RepID=A0A4V3XCB5_9AGAM|nr:hypothetical protein EW146_g9959 [Bondarzewia mesenterica]